MKLQINRRYYTEANHIVLITHTAPLAVNPKVIMYHGTLNSFPMRWHEHGGVYKTMKTKDDLIGELSCQDSEPEHKSDNEINETTEKI